jgi:hypothetical protein
VNSASRVRRPAEKPVTMSLWVPAQKSRRSGAKPQSANILSEVHPNGHSVSGS